jgi:hypothetical protein
MYTILGAGGSVSNELAKLLAARRLPFRTVSRHAGNGDGAVETRVADLAKHEQTVKAIAGSDLVFLLAGLKYDHKLWAEQWPVIIDNTVDACKQAKAKLIFFDNVYMYGKANGPMTERRLRTIRQAKGRCARANCDEAGEGVEGWRIDWNDREGRGLLWAGCEEWYSKRDGF